MIPICTFGCFVLVFLSSFVQAHTVTVSSIAEIDRLEQLIAEPFLLKNLTYRSDVIFPKEEFCYLVDLSIGQEVTRDDLRRALTYLFEKNVFKSIVLNIEDEETKGKRIHFDLTGLWRFEKLKVSGIWVGKEWYKQYYLMDPGDPFDIDKHKHSMGKIKQVCKKDGFFNVSTKSSFSYDKETKSVTVHTVIKRGTRFFVRDVRLVMNAGEGVDRDECDQIERQIYKKFIRPLCNTRYAKSSIEHQARAMKQFLAHRGFLPVAIDLIENISWKNHAVRLVWQVNVRKKRTFVFFGNRFFSHNQLLDRILQFGRSAWIVPVSILAEELRSIYRAKGFWDVDIDAQDEDGRSFFVIKEFQRAIIEQVEINQAHALSVRILLKHCFSKLKRHGVFDRDHLDRAFENLTDYYRAKGFLDMKILTHEFVPLAADNIYKLVVTVDEGECAVIDDVVIEDYPELEKQGPFWVMRKKKKPIVFDDVMLQQQKRWLADYFQHQGYLFVVIKSELVPQDDRKILCWKIEPGQKVLFGKTIIQGSSSFPVASVMRELQYKEGELWDQEKIKQSFIRLKDLQIFEAISFAPLSLPQFQGHRSVLVKMHKDDPFELRIRAGLEFQHIRQYQTFAGLAYKVGGTLMVKNPSNNGDLFRFDADVARAHREVNIKYAYPRIFSTPLNGLLHGYAIKYEQPGFIGSKKNIYTLFQQGFLLGLHYKNQFVDAGVNIGFETARMKISNDDVATRQLAEQLSCAINFDPSLLGQRVPFVFVEPTIMIDMLDNTLNPSCGTFSLVSLKGMFPTNDTFSGSYFIKLIAEQSWFVPIRRAVGALRIRFGHIFHRKFCDIMPNERFYLGGAHSIRSYETDLAPPLGCFVDAQNKGYRVPRGGKTMFNINGEIRVPAFKNVGLVLFQDVGLLISDHCTADLSLKNFVAGTGFGIRYFTPIGPLRFDIAWKWRTCVPGERRYNWYLTFGQAF